MRFLLTLKHFLILKWKEVGPALIFGFSLTFLVVSCALWVQHKCNIGEISDVTGASECTPSLWTEQYYNIISYFWIAFEYVAIALGSILIIVLTVVVVIGFVRWIYSNWKTAEKLAEKEYRRKIR